MLNRHRIDSKLLIPRHAKGTCSFCSPSDFNFPLTRARAHPVYRSHAHIILDFDWKFECFISESSLHEHPRKIIMHGWRKWSHSNHVCICAYGNVNIQIMIDLFTSLPLTFHFFSVIWVEGLWSYLSAQSCRVEANESNIIDGSCQCAFNAAFGMCIVVWSIQLICIFLLQLQFRTNRESKVSFLTHWHWCVQVCVCAAQIQFRTSVLIN